MSILNLVILISVAILTIAEIFIIRYRRSLKKFRESIQTGDRIQTRIGSTLFTVIVLSIAPGGQSMLVKQFGKQKSFLVPTSNTYPL